MNARRKSALTRQTIWIDHLIRVRVHQTPDVSNLRDPETLTGSAVSERNSDGLSAEANPVGSARIGRHQNVENGAIVGAWSEDCVIGRFPGNRAASFVDFQPNR